MPVVAQAMVEAGVAGADRRGGRHPRAGADRRAARRVIGGQGLALAWDLPLRGGQPPRGPPVRGPARTRQNRVCLRWCCLVSGGHTQLVRWRPRASTCWSAARSTTRRARRSTRSLASSAWAIRAVRRSRARPLGRPDRRSTFPRAMVHSGFDFSFSGLKTAVINHVRRTPRGGDRGCGRVVSGRCRRRARTEAGACGRRGTVARVAMAGGVAANSPLRCGSPSTPRAGRASGLFVARQQYCTDNAAMVAAAGWYRWADGPSRAGPAAVGACELPV
jgi:N6-L-threonylcarbamoyladenine synthase